MPTFKQKNVIKSYKLRLQEKLKTVTEETENATSFLNNRIEEFRKRVQQILEIKDEKCLSLYRKLSSDLESFSEKLYILQASLEEASDEESGSTDEDDDESVKLPKSEEENSRTSSQQESPSCFTENSSLNIDENVQKQSEKIVDKHNVVEYQMNAQKCTGESISHHMCSKENVSQHAYLKESLELQNCSERNLKRKCQDESINQSIYAETADQQRHLERNESELCHSLDANKLIEHPVCANLQRLSNTSVSQKLLSIENTGYAGHDEHSGSIPKDDFYSLNSDSFVKNTNSFTQSNSDLVNHQKEFISGNTISSNASVSQSSCYHSISSSINESLVNWNVPKENRDRSDSKLSKNLCSSQLSNASLVIHPTELDISSQFPATLSYIIDPGNFWIQLENSHGYKLNFPKSEYDHVKGLAAIDKGDYCLAPYKSTYHRALSLSNGRSVCEPVKVQFIDLGSIREVLLYDLRSLPKPAYEIPAQAVHCYLYGIVPTENSWSDDCIEKLKEYQNLSIETTVKAKENLYGVQLVVKLSADLDEDISIDLAQSLCLDGLALSIDELDIGQSEICRSELSKPVSNKAESSLEVSGSYDINAISNDSGVSITSAYRSSQISNQRNEIFHKVAEDHALSSAVKKVLPYDDNPLEYKDKQRKDALFENCNATNNLQSTSKTNTSNLLKSSRDSPLSSSCLLCRDKNFCLHLKVLPPSLLFVKEDMVIVMLSHIVSPQEFYVNMAMENSNLLDDLREQMTCTYESEKKLYPLKISNLSEGMFCAGRFVEDGYWYRVKIIRLNLEDKERNQVLGQFIDYGNCEIIKSCDLRPLTPVFAKHPNLAIKCSLAGISPVKGVRSSNNLPWSDDAISVFKKLTSFDRCLTAQICNVLCSSQNDAYPVLLWDTQDSKDLLINELLVEQKVALFDESFVQPPPSVHVNEGFQLDSWDPMAEEYSNDDNNYSVDDEDIEIITTGYKSKDAEYICKYFSMHGRCPKGSKCLYEHRPMLENGLTYDKEEVYCFDNVLLIPETVTNVLLQVSTIINPSHFYVILPFGCKTVDDIDSLVLKGSTYEEIINNEARALFLDIDQFYSTMLYRENTGLALACGTIVAAKRQWDNKWHRGRIVDVMDVNKPAKVFFLDSGDTEWVPRKFIKSILPQYLHAPFQAINCSLFGVEPVVSRKGESWTSDAINYFKDIVAGEILLGEIHQRSGAVYHLSLRKTLQKYHKNIAQLLVSAGFAQYQEIRYSEKKSTAYVPG